MLDQHTRHKLTTLRLHGMAEAWDEQERHPESLELSFNERFGMLVDAEVLRRDNRRRTRLLKEAKLRISTACLEDVDCSAERGLPRSTFQQLVTTDWIRQHRNLLLTGATGTGKTWLACAFAHDACRKGLKTIYRRVPRFFEELRLAQADGSYPRLLARLAKYEVLILDDWGLGRLTATQRHHLLEVMDDRYNRRATIVTSQLPIKAWHEYLGEPTVADAILDRLVHNAYKIELKGSSRREAVE